MTLGTRGRSIKMNHRVAIRSCEQIARSRFIKIRRSALVSGQGLDQVQRGIDLVNRNAKVVKLRKDRGTDIVPFLGGFHAEIGSADRHDGCLILR